MENRFVSEHRSCAALLLDRFFLRRRDAASCGDASKAFPFSLDLLT
jgi:hypothetical protein